METLKMKRFIWFAAVCAAAFQVYSPVSGAAWDFSFLKAKTLSEQTAVKNADESKQPEAMDAAAGRTDFDDFNNIDDPLYREGCKALLQKAVEEDKVKKICKEPPAQRPVMRDAPSSVIAVETTQPENKAPVQFKKSRLIKMIPADPLKTKFTL